MLVSRDEIVDNVTSVINWAGRSPIYSLARAFPVDIWALTIGTAY